MDIWDMLPPKKYVECKIYKGSPGNIERIPL